MKYEQIDNHLFIHNRQQLVDCLEENSIVIVCANGNIYRNGDQCFPFRQHADFFYLCGIDQANAILVLCPQHSNADLREMLFIEQHTTEKDHLWSGNKLSKEEARKISGINNVKLYEDFEKTLPAIILSCEHIYMDIIENKQGFSIIQDNNFELYQKLQSAYPLLHYKRLCPIVENLRLRKSPLEMDLLQKACNITAETFQDLLTKIKPNLTEYEIEGEIYRGFLTRKAIGHSFSPIVAAGKNACVLHYNMNNGICKNGDLLLVDMGAEYANYASDLSRTIPINGIFTKRQKELYQICERVFRLTRTYYTPGMSCNKIQSLVLEKMQDELLNIDLINKKDIENEKHKFDSVKRYFMHSVAHFVGLDVHDVGTKDTIFDYGMVLSCEPGLYVPEEQIGIRIETMMLVNDKPIDLMEKVPLAVEEIEDVMRKNK